MTQDTALLTPKVKTEPFGQGSYPPYPAGQTAGSPPPSWEGCLGLRPADGTTPRHAVNPRDNGSSLARHFLARGASLSRRPMLLLLGLIALACGCSSTPSGDVSSPPSSSSPYYVGLRRSSYGMEERNDDHGWWALRARQYASNFSNAVPVIVEIVGVFMSDGSCCLEFAPPPDPAARPGKAMFNANPPLDHEAALDMYDRHGVKAILQIEPGNTDVDSCLAEAHRAFGHHPCIIGYGIDAEWHFTGRSRHKAGLPVSDADARRWLETVLGFDKRYILFIKHWRSGHLPPTFRHPSLHFISDSQDFDSATVMLTEFRDWGRLFPDTTVGFQYGYIKDQSWWRKLAAPPIQIGRSIVRIIPNARYLIWVDFTADKVTFTDARPVAPHAKR